MGFTSEGMKTTEYAEYTEMEKGLLMTTGPFPPSVCSGYSVVPISSRRSPE